MKSKQLLTVMCLICLAMLVISSCVSTRKSQNSINVKLLNFDQLESAGLQEYGSMPNSLYMGIEFKGYADCANNYPAYQAIVESDGTDPVGENKLFINNISGGPGYITFTNMKGYSDEPRNCYYETVIPDAFAYLNDGYGNCHVENFVFTVNVKYDSNDEYSSKQEFDCEAVLSALNSPTNQSQSDEPIPQVADPCDWKSGIVGSWVSRGDFEIDTDSNTVLVFMDGGDYVQYETIDGVKSGNQSLASWECQQDGKLSISSSQTGYKHVVEIIDENTIMIDNSLGEKVYYVRVENK